MHRIVGWIDLALFVALIAFGLWVVACKPWGFDPAAAAALAGALFGGAALLLGNRINRTNEWHKTERELVQRVETGFFDICKRHKLHGRGHGAALRGTPPVCLSKGGVSDGDE